MKQAVMNNTKWEELRSAMDDLPYPVRWKSKDLKTGYVFGWDSDWFYHFRLLDNKVTIDAYKEIEWIEISLKNGKDEIINILQKIHVPGEILEDSVKVYGYIEDCQSVSFI